MLNLRVIDDRQIYDAVSIWNSDVLGRSPMHSTTDV